MTFTEAPPAPPTEYRVVLRPDPEDLTAAEALGWSGIPDAEVTLTPSDSSVPALTMRTSPEGNADFGSIPSGNYILWARRWLSEAELATPGIGDVDAWVAKANVTPGSRAGPDTVKVPASHRRSLVISEWAFNFTFDPVLAPFGYPFSGFLELYNNADTTAFLDGVIIGEGWWSSSDELNFPCSHSAPFRDDPEGIWSRSFQQFPGSGHDYPVAPGAIVATARREKWISVPSSGVRSSSP